MSDYDDCDGKADAEYRDYCTDKFLDEMEELREENAALRAEVERLREEVAMYRSALANALMIPQPLPAPPVEEK